MSHPRIEGGSGFTLAHFPLCPVYLQDLRGKILKCTSKKCALQLVCNFLSAFVICSWILFFTFHLPKKKHQKTLKIKTSDVHVENLAVFFGSIEIFNSAIFHTRSNTAKSDLTAQIAQSKQINSKPKKTQLPFTNNNHSQTTPNTSGETTNIYDE